MAGDYILETQASSSRFERLLKVFIFLAVLCVSGELVWLLGMGPFRPFSRIDIDGISLNSEISREEILYKAGINTASSYFSTNVKAVESA